jgi:hypothetical protein
MEVEGVDVHPEASLGFFKVIGIVYMLPFLLLYYDYLLAGAAFHTDSRKWRD